MNNRLNIRLHLSLVLVIAVCSISETAAEEVVGFDQVKPILRKRCVTCHNPDEQRGDLDLKELTALQAGSASGEIVVAGDPGASLLYTTIAHLEDPVMPPNSPQISAREQDIIRRWIEGGLATKTGTSPESSEATRASPLDSEFMPGEVASSQALKTHTPAGGLVAIRPIPQPAALTSLATHPTRDLAAVNGLQQAVFFKPSTGELLGAVDIPEGDVSAMQFSADGQLLMVAAGKAAISGSVVAYDVDTGKRLWQIADETDSILSFDLAPDGNTLAVGGPSKTLRLYELPSGRELHALKKHTDWILSIRFSPDGLLLASSDRFGEILVWEPVQGTLFHNLKDHLGAAHALAWDRDSETLVSGGEDGKLRTWNLHHGELTSSWNAQVGAILDIVRAQNFFAAAGRDGKVSVWTHADAMTAQFDLEEQAEVLAHHSSSNRLIVGNTSGQATILNAQTLEPAGELQLPSDTDAMQQLLARLDQAEQVRLAAIESPTKQRVDNATPEGVLEQTAASFSMPASEPLSEYATKTEFPKSTQPNPVDWSVLLASEIEANQKHAAELEIVLQDSHNMLSNMAQNNERLIEWLRQSTAAQTQLAQQISQQVQMLEALRNRTQQLQRSLSK